MEEDDYNAIFYCMEKEWREDFLNRLKKCPNKIRKDILRLDPLPIIQMHPFVNNYVSNKFFKNNLYKLYPSEQGYNDVVGWITYDMCDLIEAACCDLSTLLIICGDLVSRRADVSASEEENISLKNTLFDYGKYLLKSIKNILESYGIDYVTKNPDIALGLLNGGQSVIANLEEFSFHIYPANPKQPSNIYTGEIRFGIYRPVELILIEE